MKHIASVSFGKDSVAMLLLIIKNKLPLDEVVFYDTGMEFDAIYKVRDKIVKYLHDHKIKYTELKPKKPFIETMTNYKHTARNGSIKNGYGWCGGLCRWGTSQKIQAINKYCKDAIQYIGIAYDEVERYKRLDIYKKAPLYEMKITEAEALEICFKNDIHWYENGIELYTILKRVSCWCCRNKNLKELANYKKYLPNYYERLTNLENIIGEPMKKPKYLKERKL